jgi:hypothetical protein
MPPHFRVVRAGVLALCLALGGCAVVIVQSDDGHAHLSAWPLGVRVEASALGASSGCETHALGAAALACDVVPLDRCGVALVHGRPANSQAWARLSDDLRARCLKGIQP